MAVYNQMMIVNRLFINMGFTLTAEGIETKEMADEMHRIGCDFLQGYLFSPPVPIEEFKDKCASHVL